MSLLETRIQDKNILKLIRKCLQSGIMINGVKVTNERGVPQGSPLSPLLSNIILDELDKELERRGHRFCRYADDCNAYVKSRKAGIRLKKSITEFIEKKLKLKVNEEKSAVDRPWRRKFLGFSFTYGPNPRIRISKESLKAAKQKIREITVSFKTHANRRENKEAECVSDRMVQLLRIGRDTQPIQESRRVDSSAASDVQLETMEEG